MNVQAVDTSFEVSVKNVVRAIPRGTTLAYGQVAAHAGFPNAARAVGRVMKHNFDPNIPCHRVIRSDGKIGEYNRGGTKAKIALLKLEGAIT